MRTKFTFLSIATLSLTVVACDAAPPLGEDTSPESIEVVTLSLGPDATVADAISSECSTASIRGLSQQLVDEVQCDHPGTFERIDDIGNLQLGAAVFPWLQTAAAEALRDVASRRDASMTVNSAYRTLAQQLMLYRWYREGRRCGIALAASPGTSNHEEALAVDISDYSAWRTSFQAGGFTWLGGSDPVHFDYTGGGETVALNEMSVLAFQRLWNRNHPDDRLDEDGDYGTETEKRILKSPASGFQIGAHCIEQPGSSSSGGASSSGASGAPAPRPDGGGAGQDAGPGHRPLQIDPPDMRDDAGGCTTAAGPGSALPALMLVLVARRRRRR